MMTLSDLRRQVFSRLGPFWLYLSLAVALNAYPLAAAIRAGVEYNGDFGECRRAMSWIYTNASLCVLHIVAAIYVALIGRAMVRRWQQEVETKAQNAAPATGDGAGAAESGAATGAAEQKQAQQEQSTDYVQVEGPSGSATEEHLSDVAQVAASAPTTVDVLRALSTRWTLRLYFVLIVYYLCWTTVGLKRHMMNAGYCGGNIRGHVADSVLSAVLFLVLGQGALCFGAWRAGRVMAQGRVSGLSRPAYGVQA